MNPPAAKVEAAQIAQAHALYCEITGQSLSLGFDRERLWYELLRTGVTLPQVGQLLRYLQREIREGRRNVGALKLSNFLQPDRFEEDLAISRIALRPATVQTPPPRPARRTLENRNKGVSAPSNSSANLKRPSANPEP